MFASAPENLEIDGPLIAGVDEAGRGPLAGPVVAAAVILCKDLPKGLGDSKKLSAKVRGRLDPLIRETCAWGVGIVEPDEIDQLNIFGATMLAMTIATARLADALGCNPAEVLIDGNKTPQGRCADWRWPAQAIVKGDAKEPCISAASIIAKQWRDRIMLEAAQKHPQYGWERNMGYPTAEHVSALRSHGITPMHRKSFGPVAQLDIFSAKNATS